LCEGAKHAMASAVRLNRERLQLVSDPPDGAYTHPKTHTRNALIVLCPRTHAHTRTHTYMHAHVHAHTHTRYVRTHTRTRTHTRRAHRQGRARGWTRRTTAACMRVRRRARLVVGGVMRGTHAAQRLRGQMGRPTRAACLSLRSKPRRGACVRVSFWPLPLLLPVGGGLTLPAHVGHVCLLADTLCVRRRRRSSIIRDDDHKRMRAPVLPCRAVRAHCRARSWSRRASGS
jgi:hypothetical protein